MATPSEKIKRLRLDSETPFPDAYKTPEAGSYGGKQGPLTEALRAKRERQSARTSESSGRPKTSAMGSSENVSTGTGSGTSSFDSDKTFKQAFAEARKAGQDQFTWKGKKYTTEMAKPKKAESEATIDSDLMEAHDEATRFKKGGCVKMAKGGSASSRADGCAQRGKTKGRMV